METAVQAISLQIENAPGAGCLLAGRTAALTCVIDGFPRPRIEFLKGSVTIVPTSSERISNISFDQVRITYSIIPPYFVLLCTLVSALFFLDTNIQYRSNR